MYNIKINSLDKMRDFGKYLGTVLNGGEVITLNGDLGAGKTHLTKYIGEGMGITEYITSPTFSILNIYNGKIDLYHFDTYRLEGIDDFSELGFDDYLFSQGVSVVEWADRIKNELPKDRLDIRIHKVGEFERLLTLSSTGENSNKLLERIKDEYIRD